MKIENIQIERSFYLKYYNMLAKNDWSFQNYFIVKETDAKLKFILFIGH